ncbi:MAG TPA: DNA polymerase IV [Anaerohalosphaeraceae bacterium]|jgi:DNA polymerase-4|nr:DNA polymerase IV [Anaerohalosphaeraceae bacterium]HRT50003.1 DNA polymerase IV [Anaerohalosphaeraceae bacterium]HRT85806.1 DNA polymerase IV [Anaerohalosphaeraceae bacterium]
MQNRQIIHVDMDAFYASVEQHDNPSLKGKPVIVGGDPAGRGVVSAASYEARRFGVHSAMPMKQAMRLCPHAVVIRGRMDRYVEVSRIIRGIFGQFTPLIEPLSLDEASLDVTGSLVTWKSAEHIGRTIKQTIRDRTGLTASVGVAPNKFLAKVASDLDKPDGFVVITEENKQEVLDPLPVRAIWGIGPVTGAKLQQHGIHTIRQLREYPPDALRRLLGNTADSIIELAHGIDDRPVEPTSRARSLSAEHTFPQDVADPNTLASTLLDQVEEVAARLRAERLRAKTITLKLRYGDFKTITRSRSFAESTDCTAALWKAAAEVFETWRSRAFRPLRLIGFAATGLKPDQGRQLTLFAEPEDVRQARLDRTIDEIREKYGFDTIRRRY